MATCTADDVLNGATCNLFSIHRFDNQSSYFNGQPAFSQGVGYAVVLGFGVAFALITWLFYWAENTFSGVTVDSEHFQTAGRNQKTGLISSDIISHWTWGSTFLYNPVLFWYYGIAGLFWSAAGATVSIVFFGVLGLELKQKAPTAHTIMELVKTRWGTPAHLTFLAFMLCTNWFVSVTNVQGGAQIITSLTGINIYGACVLIPVGIVIYVAIGGMKATLQTSYIHTVIILVTMLIFSFKMYAGTVAGGVLGDVRKAYDNLMLVGQARPVVGGDGLGGNTGGSYLTFWSPQAFCYGVYQVLGSVPLIFNDQAYWQTSISASPFAVIYSYAVSGLLWFAIPILYSMSLGVAAVGLDLPLSSTELNNVLLVPAVGLELLGKAGGVLVIIIVFMATTSAVSSELVGVSSLLVFDLWRPYIRPQASGKELINLSRLFVVFWGAVAGGSTAIVIKLSFNFGWFFLVSGVFTPAAVPSLIAVLYWRRTRGWHAVVSAASGIVCSMIAWLIVAWKEVGNVSISSTEQLLPILASSLAAFGGAAIVLPVLTCVWPDKEFEWSQLHDANLAVKDDEENGAKSIEKANLDGEFAHRLAQAKQIGIWWAIGFSLLMEVVWPLLALPAKTFSYGYFYLYVVIAFIWGIVASVYLIFAPLVESRQGLWTIFYNLITWNKVQKRVQPITEDRLKEMPLEKGFPVRGSTTMP